MIIRIGGNQLESEYVKLSVGTQNPPFHNDDNVREGQGVSGEAGGHLERNPGASVFTHAAPLTLSQN